MRATNWQLASVHGPAGAERIRPASRGFEESPGAFVAGVGTAFPPARDQDDLWQHYFAPRIGDDRWARRVFLSAGVRRRHLAVDPTVEDVAEWSTGVRMSRYLGESLPLAKTAVVEALRDAGRSPREIGLLCVVSCTGYSTPGVDVHLARDLGMEPSVDRIILGHMGCHAALPGLGVARDYVVARGRPAVVVCIEVCSLHAQPLSARSDQLIAHALFSDAAAAVVLEPPVATGTSQTPGAGPARPRWDGSAGSVSRRLNGTADGWPRRWGVVEVASRTDPTNADHMTWDVTDLGFRMGLSRRVPDVLGPHVRPLVEELLDRNGMVPEQVAAWAVHPGGPRVLDVVADRLGLGEDAIAASRRVLGEHGNCSSATVLVVLQDLLARADLPAGSGIVALAFGPGLTVSGALLRGSPADSGR